MRYDDNKQRIKHYALYAVVIVIVGFLQNSRVAFPEILGARAFLLVPLSITIAMHEREIPAALFGAFAGIVWDISSGNDGFNTLVLMLLASVCSILISHLMRRNLVTAFVLSGGALIIYELIYVIINILLSGGGNPLGVLLSFYLPSAIYTLVFVPVVYCISQRIYDLYKGE